VTPIAAKLFDIAEALIELAWQDPDPSRSLELAFKAAEILRVVRLLNLAGDLPATKPTPAP
jgi:hypothetical protein